MQKSSQRKCFQPESSTVFAGEKGNIKYEYFFPMADTEALLLIDSWEDQSSIDLHHASPMMAQIIRLREKYGLHMKVERYVLADNGIPEADRKFIKE